MSEIYSYMKDHYLFELDTTLVKVILQEEFAITIGHGTQEKRTCKGIVLKDTVMFPEGGGQPPDHGLLKFDLGDKEIEAKVWYVVKREKEIVHLIEDDSDVLINDLPAGTQVYQKLDATRRVYHMNQHTGQHLISCLAEDQFQLKTVSWYLGKEISYIELDIRKSSMEDVSMKMSLVESQANRYIREGRNIKSMIFPPGADHSDLDKATTRGLPKNHEGVIQVIETEGVNSIVCCGTHVADLGRLEILKLLGIKMKKKGYCFVYFVAGEEYFKKVFDAMKDREKKICDILNTNVDDCINKIQSQKEKLASTTKMNKLLLEANARFELEIFILKKPEIPFFTFHTTDGGMDLLYFLAARRKDLDAVDNLTFLLTSGRGPVLDMFIAASKHVMDQVIPQLPSVEAFGRNLGEFRFQGKVSLKYTTALGKLIEDAMKNQLSTSD